MQATPICPITSAASCRGTPRTSTAKPSTAPGINTPIPRNGATDTREEVAHKVAWAAVKRQYRKVGDEWREKD